MMKKAQLAKAQIAEKAAAIEEQALEKKRAEEVQAIMPQQQTASAASSVAPVAPATTAAPATSAAPVAPATTAASVASATPAAESAEGFAAAHGLTLEELNAIVDAVNKKKANKKPTSKAAPAAPATPAPKPAAPAAPAPKPAAPAEPTQKAKKVPHTVVSTPTSSASAAPAQAASAQAATTPDSETVSLVTVYRTWLHDRGCWLPLRDYAAARQLSDSIQVIYAWEDSEGNILRPLKCEEIMEVFSVSALPGARKGYVYPGCPNIPLLDVFAALQCANFNPNLLTQVWGLYDTDGKLDHMLTPEEAGSMLP